MWAVYVYTVHSGEVGVEVGHEITHVLCRMSGVGTWGSVIICYVWVSYYVFRNYMYIYT